MYFMCNIAYVCTIYSIYAVLGHLQVLPMKYALMHKVRPTTADDRAWKQGQSIHPIKKDPLYITSSIPSSMIQGKEKEPL